MVAYGLTKRTTDDMESLKSVVGLQHRQSALMLASQRGHTATVQALIGAGADLNLQENCGHTALMLTSPHYTATVQALIGAGADPNVKSEVGVKACGGGYITKAVLYGAYRVGATSTCVGDARGVNTSCCLCTHIELPLFFALHCFWCAF
jgi:hypothetical protein